jgi:hypothetical protein
MRCLRIGSYFSVETDLAEAMRSWPEFVSGTGYDVDLKDTSTTEAVTVRYVESGEEAHVHIISVGTSVHLVGDGVVRETLGRSKENGWRRFATSWNARVCRRC